MQKSAEVIVGAILGRRTEQLKPRVGQLASTNHNEAEVPYQGAKPTGVGRNPGDRGQGAEWTTAAVGRTKSENHLLMEQVVERSNMRRAYDRVRRNRGAPGVDRLRVEDLKDWLLKHWPSVKRALLEGRYIPSVIRRIDIPKPNGGVRTLGVPTVVDRLIQQALHQVLQPIFEPTFSDGSYGFRPCRSALDAVVKAREYVQGGKDWVVDIDLEKFFDRVNHDVLMSRIAGRVEDRRVLVLIRRFLEAGMMHEGLVEPRTEGTPQGGPLSPLLSNILLTDLDRELEKRQLAFCRYADDCNIYVGSEQAGNRVMMGIKLFIENRLMLRVNAQKSAVARPWKRKFLGYAVTVIRGNARVRIAPEGLRRLMARAREILRRGRGRALSSTIKELNPVLRGWANYFRLTANMRHLDELDWWLRRRLRCLLWRQWQAPKTRERKLASLGISPERAWKSSVNGRGAWWNAGAKHMNQALPTSYFARMGLVSLRNTVQELQRIS
ncbi:group II intron reverse transcriptase/maturase [Pseudomonas aeruginosa]|nr:group II intron reverse transcriptase/maturase [Pseudomonas aeruginosa]